MTSLQNQSYSEEVTKFSFETLKSSNSNCNFDFLESVHVLSLTFMGPGLHLAYLLMKNVCVRVNSKKIFALQCKTMNSTQL